jgi:hypothetical protein
MKRYADDITLQHLIDLRKKVDFLEKQLIIQNSLYARAIDWITEYEDYDRIFDGLDDDYIPSVELVSDVFNKPRNTIILDCKKKRKGILK